MGGLFKAKSGNDGGMQCEMRLYDAMGQATMVVAVAGAGDGDGGGKTKEVTGGRRWLWQGQTVVGCCSGGSSRQ